ncbi:cell wall-binding repeat-containing protein, partial [Eggerthellaceae bacterium zg-1084]|uniref:Rib/alpha-like domain-containing protein n=1 Tax=Berryella wangjianweii TaxID=2734634 RepID=UPI001553E8F7
MKTSNTGKGLCSAVLACGLVLSAPLSALALDRVPEGPAAPLAAADDAAEQLAVTLDLTVMLENAENEVVERNLKGATWRLHRIVPDGQPVPAPIEIKQSDHTDDPLASFTGIHWVSKLAPGDYRLEFVGIDSTKLPSKYYVARQSTKVFKVHKYSTNHVSNITLREGEKPDYIPEDDYSNYFTPSYSSDPNGTEFTVAAGKTLNVPAPTNVLGNMAMPKGMRYRSSDIQHPHFVTVNPDGTLKIAPDKLERQGVHDIVVWAVYPDGSWDRIFAKVRVTEATDDGDEPIAPLPKVTGTATVKQATPEGLVAEAQLEGLVSNDLPAGFYVGLIERGTELDPTMIPQGAVHVKDVDASGKATVAIKAVAPEKLDRTKQYDLLVWKSHGRPGAELNRAVLPLAITSAQWDAIMAGHKPQPGADLEKARLAGANAFGTMQKIHEAGWKGETGGTVVVAAFEGYWDALAASGLAGFDKAPVVMTYGDRLSPEAEAILKAARPSKVYVMGGEAA